MLMIYDEVGHTPLDGLTLGDNDGATTRQVAPDAGGKMIQQTLALDGLGHDADVQPRLRLSDEVIADYAALYRDGGAEALPPLIVYHTGNDAWLADGFHRVAAAKQAGLAALPADVRPGTKRDAILCACGANKHGKPLTNAEKRRLVTRMLTDEEWRQWSSRDIARHCGVSIGMVSKLQQELSVHDEQIAKPRTRTVHRGQSTYTMDTGAIGQRAASLPATLAEDAEAGWPEAGAPAMPVTPGQLEARDHPASPQALCVCPLPPDPTPEAPQDQPAPLTEPPPATSATASQPGSLDTGDDVTAPPGSRAWVLAVRSRFGMLLDTMQTTLQQMGAYLRTLAATQGYQHVEAADGAPFVSLRAFATTPCPWGLGYDPDGVAGLVTALQGLIEDQPAASDMAPLPEPLGPLPLAKVSHPQRIRQMLPVLPASFAAKDVAALTGLTMPEAGKALWHLRQSGEVRRAKRGRYEKP
jgi:hypothetical protein